MGRDPWEGERDLYAPLAREPSGKNEKGEEEAGLDSEDQDTWEDEESEESDELDEIQDEEPTVEERYFIEDRKSVV